ncbi:MAG TPA: mannose-1-phosphate guanylyltransferase/mannose-6-phosphate isomerase [Xanthobacteraceae bacterium]|jgi:mannose-1-phosphate guanylyltransferase/mannose-6-phosphate isomerase|nr:mannose-1-phosphate guanylyltransferase/mannose-6-phosphate isomerase [Xanthobacteraceae bacterium]
MTQNDGSATKLITPVIICGGVGTRLWPLSRESRPKQFIPLMGDLSTFQQVLRRVSDPEIFGPPVVITNEAFRFTVAEQIQSTGITADIILEPMGRDSGPAIAVAAEFAKRRDPASVLLVLAADHIVRDGDAFRESCRQAVTQAFGGRLVTFGVRPDAPATSYGYIKPGARLDGSDVQAVESFVEKPDAATAAKYVAAGYLWNSGNFMFRADVMLEEIAKYEPAMQAAAAASVAKLTQDLDFLRLPEKEFAQATKKSIDFAVMEKTSLAAVLPVDFGWSDIGSWGALWSELKHDTAGNSIDGPVAVIDTHNSLIFSDETVLTSVIGLDDVIVVSTSDSVLVVPKSHSEKVKGLVEHLKKSNRKEAIEHRRMYRPWGFYQGVDVGPRHQVKRIVVNPAGKLSLQKHHHRSEHWVVVKGTAEVTINDDVRIVHENESIYVPIGSKHRLVNPGKIPLELIEVQVGSYLGEDDIIRLDDVYHRT